MDDYSDLSELGIDVNEEDELSVKFRKCSKHAQSIAGTLDNETLLKIYGLYKQSIEGTCTTTKPSWYDIKGNAKWDAWKSLGDMDKNEAKKKYIQLVLALSPEFSFAEASKMEESWVKVSSPVPDAIPLEKTICDYIRNGDIIKVTSYLKTHFSNIDALDSSGMGLIHYAADIGNQKILEVLINAGANINLKDCDGQTALHYATSCGHLNCIKLLLDKRAKCDIRDSNNCTPNDVACDTVVQDMLK